MAESDTRTLAEIKCDTERARAGLTDTVDQLKSSVSETANELRARLSPDAIKSEVSHYVKSRGEAMLDSVTEAARRNPLQAAAVGVGLAMPVLRILRSIPAPVLMVGAGLYLAGTKRGQELTRQATNAASALADDVTRRAHDFRDSASDAVAGVRDYASNQYDAVRGAASAGVAQVKDNADAVGASIASRVDAVRGQARDTGARLSGEANDLARQGAQASGSMTDTLRDTASTLRDTASEMASGVASRLRDTVDSSIDSGRDAAAMARDAALRARDRAAEMGGRAMDMGGRAGKTVTETISQNPLLVAGVGLVLGGLIASALPRSRIEDGLMGGASKGLKDRARDTVEQGLEGVKEAAGSAYDNVARAADQEGLNAEGVNDAAKDLGQRARKVGEAATKAFDA